MTRRSVGTYELVEQIGEGATATVWRARHRMLGMDFALKLFSATVGTGGTRARVRFLREAKALSLVRSNFVVGLSDFGVTDDEVPYLVMEWIQGYPLSALIEGEAPLSADLTRHLAEQITIGLDALHQAGAIHRDIKPANVMLVRPDDDGLPFAKIVDLGLVCGDPTTFPALTRPDAVLGTPAYIPPEQITRKGLDHRADLYSLGLTMYEMLTGDQPFLRGSILEILSAQLEQVPASLAPEHGPLGALVDQLIEKDPRRRPADAAEVESRLAALAPVRLDTDATAVLTRALAEQLEPTLVPNDAAIVPTSASTIRPPPRRSPLAIGAAMVAVFVAATAAAVSTTRDVTLAPVRTTPAPSTEVVVTPRTVPVKTSPAAKESPSRTRRPPKPRPIDTPEPLLAIPPPETPPATAPATKKSVARLHRDAGDRLRKLKGIAPRTALADVDQKWFDLANAIRAAPVGPQPALHKRTVELLRAIDTLEQAALRGSK